MSKIMKVFISQPMHGKSKKQVILERETIVNYLRSNHEVIDSLIINDYPEDINERIWYLGRAIKRMSKADAVYFMDGWKDSSGCKVEHFIAMEYGLKILHD